MLIRFSHIDNGDSIKRLTHRVLWEQNMADENSNRPEDAKMDAGSSAPVWTPYEGAEDSLMPENPESPSYRDGLHQGTADEIKEDGRKAKDRDEKNVFTLGGVESQEKMLKKQNLAEAGNEKITGSGGYGTDKKALEEKQRMNEYFRRMAGGYMTPQQWLSQTRDVAGVNMTYGQIMNARKKILENPDVWSEQAVKKGLIRKGEEDEFIRAIRRKQEIEEYRMKHGGAYESPDMEEEDKRIDKKYGKAMDKTLADVTNEGLGYKQNRERSQGGLYSASGRESDGTQRNDVRRSAAAFTSLMEPAGGETIGGAFRAAVYAESRPAGEAPRNETANASKTVVSFRAAASPTTPDASPPDGKTPQTDRNIGSGLGV